MTDRPILFSGAMVRAILDGRKTQTRRVLNPQPYPLENRPGFWNASGVVGGRICISDRALLNLHHKPDAGDRLWVREAWHAARSLDRTSPREIPHDADIEHAATARSYAEIGLKGKLRPGIHMPRWASRLTLTVTDVRVQRLQEISATDAKAEGIEYRQMNVFGMDRLERCHFYRGCFQCLWDSINVSRGFGWESNPWVVAISFSVQRSNIDNLVAALNGEMRP